MPEHKYLLPLVALQLNGYPYNKRLLYSLSRHREVPPKDTITFLFVYSYQLFYFTFLLQECLLIFSLVHDVADWNPSNILHLHPQKFLRLQLLLWDNQER